MARTDWPALIAELQRRPKRWELRFPNHPVGIARTIRLRRARALRLDSGRVEVRVTNRYRTNGGTNGDIWVRWMPMAPPGD